MFSMLLSLWYSDRCTRQIKLMVCIATCAVIFYCTEIQKLPTIFAILSLALGIATHALYQYTHRLKQEHPYAQTLRRLTSIVPLTVLVIMIFMLPAINQLYTALQCIGFSALGLFLVSIYENRSPRHDSND